MPWPFCYQKTLWTWTLLNENDFNIQIDMMV